MTQPFDNTYAHIRGRDAIRPTCPDCGPGVWRRGSPSCMSDWRRFQRESAGRVKLSQQKGTFERQSAQAFRIVMQNENLEILRKRFGTKLGSIGDHCAVPEPKGTIEGGRRAPPPPPPPPHFLGRDRHTHLRHRLLKVEGFLRCSRV